MIISADLHALVHFNSRNLDFAVALGYSVSRCWLKISLLQAAARMYSQEDGFAPYSPKKVVSQAAQRRRTADEQAREERFHRDLAHPNAFAALVDDGVSHELSQGDNREEPGQECVAENRLVPLSRLDAAYSYCILR